MSGNNNQRKRPAQQESSGMKRYRAEESRERFQRLPAENQNLSEINRRAPEGVREDAFEPDEVVMPRNRRATALNRVQAGIHQIQRRIEEELEQFQEAQKIILHQDTVINSQAYKSILNQINELLLQARQTIVRQNEETVPRQEPGPSNQ